MEQFLTKFIEFLWNVAEKYIFPWVILREYEAGVILRLGKYHRNLKKGWNWKMPLFEEPWTCVIKPETVETKKFTVTTKDNHTVTMSIIGQYSIIDPKKWLLEANDAASNVMHHLVMVAADYITDYDYEKLKKDTAYNPIRKKLNKEIEYLGAEFLIVGYGSIAKTTPISLINN